MASYLLKEKLNSKGLSTLVEDTNMTEFLNINNWNHASSYKASRILILDKKNKYNTLKYFIDIPEGLLFLFIIDDSSQQQNIPPGQQRLHARLAKQSFIQ